MEEQGYETDIDDYWFEYDDDYYSYETEEFERWFYGKLKISVEDKDLLMKIVELEDERQWSIDD